MKRTTIHALGLVLLNSLALSLPAAIPATERAALIALYNSTNGSGWSIRTGWKKPPLHTDGFAMPGTEGTWIGITVTMGHVTRIGLMENNLSGPIPGEIGNLARLTTLELYYNDLNGLLPTQIGNLINLRSLNLNGNRLDGSIPTQIGNLINLTSLDLGSNGFTGIIPTSIGKLIHLQYLCIWGGGLTGAIPSEIGTLTSLEQLILANNKLTGAIPPEIGNLTKLAYLSLNQNNLTGDIPSGIGNLTRLTDIDISSNKITGTIPASIGNLANLKELDLYFNQLSGIIPTQIGNLTSLQELNFGANKLTGTIPIEIGNLTQLQALTLDNNQLSGAIPSQIGNLENLVWLSLKSNQLTGAIPASIGNLADLRVLNLFRNRLSGAIPASIGNLTQVWKLELGYNQLKGEIPASLANLTSFTYTETFIYYNGLYTNDAGLAAFLNQKGPGWSATQTVAPGNVRAIPVNSTTFNLTWDPIEYTGDTGGYRIFVGTSSGGPYGFYQQTANKSVASMLVTGLNPGTTYYFVIQARTDPHGFYQQNTIDSDNSAEVSGAWLPIYSISGAVTLDGSPLAGVIMSGLPGDPVSDSSGNYSAAVSLGWTGTVTPKAAGYLFSPASRAYNHISADQADQGYTAQTAFTISGTVTLAGAPLPNVVMNGLPGNPVTDSLGNYSATVSPGWSGTATPARRHFTFAPDHIDYSSIAASTAAQNYAAASISPLPEPERAALIALYNSTNGDSWTDKNGWKTPPLFSDGFAAPGSEGTWHGISVSAGHVTLIDLFYNNLSGSIPAGIGDLTGLGELNLGANKLTGSIPDSIGNLTELQRLHLNDNQLTGSIPASIGNLTQLITFSLFMNHLTGSIPPQIGNLTSLQYLSFHVNQLNGPLPAEIGGLSNLKNLNLSKNQITGPIPAGIGDLANLQYLYLEQNQFMGPIPQKIGSLTNLKLLNLGTNQITGAIPAWIGNLASLQSLYLDHNQLAGSIPPEIGNLAELETLDLSFNQIAGSIPGQIGDLQKLTRLYLQSNQLTGTIPVNSFPAQPIRYLYADIGFNGLYASDPGLVTRLYTADPDWAATQTITPINVQAAPVGGTAVNLTWDAILYTSDTGGYRVFIGTASGGPYTFFQQTANKSTTSLTVTSLNPGTPYYFVIRTRTDAHGDQQNTIESGNSAEVSNNSILAPQIAVTSPTSGSQWEKGKTYPITWQKQGAQNAYVKISLYKGTSTLVQVLTAKTANDGSFDWLIPKTLATGNGYFIRVKTVDNLVKDDSDKFSIIVPAITITSPAAGTIWAKGTTKTIAWTKTGSQAANVRIQLFKDTIKKLDITLSTPNSGSYNWAIPSTLVNGTYTIKVITLDGKVTGVSKGFTIVKSAGLTLTVPNGNEIMKPIEIQAIRWTAVPDVMEVKLEFSRDNGSTYATIADHVENTGSYEWPVPVNFTRNGIVRISDASGRPWLDEGMLEFKFKFNYGDDGEEPGAVVWFGSNDPKAPSYEFGRIDIGGNTIGFGGLSRAFELQAGGWHELRVRFDFRRDTAEIRLDDQPLFDNAPLGTTRERYFQPNLVLQAGGEKALDFAMDDLAISVVRDGNAMEEPLRFLVLAEEFDRYDDKANALANCWRLSGASDKRNGARLQAEGGQNKSLRLSTEPGRRLMIRLPFSLPENAPFDISDQCFIIDNNY